MQPHATISKTSSASEIWAFTLRKVVEWNAKIGNRGYSQPIRHIVASVQFMNRVLAEKGSTSFSNRIVTYADPESRVTLSCYDTRAACFFAALCSASVSFDEGAAPGYCLIVADDGSTELVTWENLL